MRRRTAVVVALLSGTPATAANPIGSPYLVQDLRVGRSGSDATAPENFLTLGGRLLFATWSGGPDDGIWAVSDGTRSVELVSAADSYRWTRGTPATTPFAAFWSGDQADTWLLHCSDGTPGGTRTVHAIDPAVGYPFLDQGVATTDGRAIFMGYDSDHGLEPWGSDCTLAGTSRLADLVPGELGSRPSGFVRRANEVCFVAQVDGGHGLICTGGTPQSTREVARFTGIYETNETLLTPVGSRVVFLAETPGGFQLVGSDGTSAGTRVLTALPPAGEFVNDPHPQGAIAYFVADDVVHGQEIWQTDGTPSGTQRITEFGYAFAVAPSSQEGSIARASGWTYFLATDGTTPIGLWRSNGDPGSTRRVILPAGVAIPPTGARLRAAHDSILLALSSSSGTEYHSIDGATAEVSLLADICPGSCGSNPSDLVPVDGSWFFTAWLGDRYEIFLTDGRPSGTRRVTWTPSGSAASGSAEVPAVALFDGELFHAGASFPYGSELFSSAMDGSPSRLVADLSLEEAGTSPRSLLALEGSVLFRSCDGLTESLYSSGGERDAIQELADLGSCPNGSLESRLFPVPGGAVFFGGAFLQQVWATDGTAGGTGPRDTSDVDTYPGRAASDGSRFWYVGYSTDRVEIRSLGAATGGPTLELVLPSSFHSPGDLFATDQYLFFTVSDSGTGQRRVARLDGASGSFAVLQPSLGYDFGRRFGEPSFVRVDDQVYFSDGWTPNQTIWRCGVASGPAESVATFESSQVSLLSGMGTDLYFLLLGDRIALWKSDGSTGGTALLRDLGRPASGTEITPVEAAAVDSWLLFNPWTQEIGRELWATNGTTSGTFPLPELAPGIASSDPHSFLATPAGLLFTAWDPVFGAEVRRLDPQSGVIERLSDIAPGSRSSYPEGYAVAEDHLFFAANDGLRASELWALSLVDQGCAPSSRTLCLNHGRFQVESFWLDFFDNRGGGTAVQLTPDTGSFWFFDAANAEAVLKVLDALGVNNRFWVFYAALSNVEYAVDVTDTATQVKRRYFNPPGRYASVGDVDAFDPFGLVNAPPFNEIEASSTDGRPFLRDSFLAPEAGSGSCLPSELRLCLQQGRFAVVASWRDFQGNTGVGTAVSLSADTGYFWFFNDANVEAIVKVLDGRPVNDRFWVYYGALSNVEYTLTVTDTLTGAVRQYLNPPGRFASVGDNEAF